MSTLTRLIHRLRQRARDRRIARACRRAPLGPDIQRFAGTGHFVTVILRYNNHSILRTAVNITWTDHARILLITPEGARSICSANDIVEIHEPHGAREVGACNRADTDQ